MDFVVAKNRDLLKSKKLVELLSSLGRNIPFGNKIPIIG